MINAIAPLTLEEFLSLPETDVTYELREHRKRLLKAFQKSPSLKPYYETVFAECYQDGRELASDETGLSLAAFPTESPFTPEETLNPDYLPD